MPVSYKIVPIPRWYFADLTGRPLGGGYMSTWRSLDKNTQKPIYTDATGTNAWTNPVFFNANGEAPGMFFFADDEPYFLKIFDSAGVQQFTVDGFGPAISGGGGGGTTTLNNFLENYIVNNNFLMNQGTLANIQSGTTIAPSNHHGLITAATAFATIPFSGSDTLFVRSNNTATDNLTFATADFAAGTVPLTNDVTPEFYINLACTVAGSESLKAVQFPVYWHVKNLEQTPLTAIIWAKGNTGTQNLTMNFVQYFGTGSVTTPVVTPIPINASPLVTGTWTSYVGHVTPPSVLGKALGSGGDDATYLQVCFPTGAQFNISFTKPKLYLDQNASIGSVFPEAQTYDYVDRIVNSPRTGDIRVSLNNFSPYGWVAMNDGTIGSATSGATTRANIDTWPLYATMYVNVSDTNAPVSGGRTAPGNTVAAAITDFALNKPMALTKTLGRMLASAGTPSSGTNTGTNWALGQTTGNELVTLVANNLPAHTHSATGGQNFVITNPAGAFQIGAGAGITTSANTDVNTTTNTAVNVLNPSVHYNVFIKL